MEVVCSKCNTNYNIPDNKWPKKRATLKCKNCGNRITIDPIPMPSPIKDDLPILRPVESLPVAKETDMRFKEYKVVHIVEGGCGTVLLGSSGIPLKKMEVALNDAAKEGWQVVFQIIEAKRFLLFWTREAVIMTLGR